MTVALIIIFLAGYVAITMEHGIKLNKAASALLLGGVCWTVLMAGSADTHKVLEDLQHHLGEISGILFFLIGAMAVVELIDAHEGFEIITTRLKTRKATTLLIIVGVLTFFLSAILDNLTTTIVMVSLLRKLVSDPPMRLKYIGLVIIAANAGGAWSPMGDVTTTMLWIGGQISAVSIMKALIIPSLVCMLVPLAVMYFQMRARTLPAIERAIESRSTERDRNIIFFTGIAVLICVPVFKSITHLPPFMGMLIGLGILWVVSEIVHKDKDAEDKIQFSVAHALGKIDTPSVLFFLGILLGVSALQSAGILAGVAAWLTSSVGNIALIVLIIGLLSALVDNVPLVAAAMGMYAMDQYPQDDFLWTFLAFSAGTGGSALIIGSAAGVAAMGIEKISFGWYLKKISWLALLGYFAGAGVFLMLR
jgi:Na+/H+ antiporter NhaD/arsenite permease-like protein